MKSIRPKDVEGIEVFEMKDDGCLIGSWTDYASKGEMFNEISKIQKKMKISFVGKYSSVWIEDGNKIIHATLEIEMKKGIYYLQWKVNKSDVEYNGSGFKISNLLVVTYWKS